MEFHNGRSTQENVQEPHRQEQTVTWVEDKKSGELRRPHHIDLKTGLYKGRQVLAVKTDA